MKSYRIPLRCTVFFLFSNTLVACICPLSDQVLTSTSGTVTDGAGNYANNEYCSWTIMPSQARIVTISFLEFRTESNMDTVQVSSCINSLCKNFTESAVYSGTSIPPKFTSTTGIVKVEFTSNAANSDSGFTAAYASSVLGITEYSICPDEKYLSMCEIVGKTTAATLGIFLLGSILTAAILQRANTDLDAEAAYPARCIMHLRQLFQRATLRPRSIRRAGGCHPWAGRRL